MSAIIYLLQVSACLAIFYGFYYLLLNRLTFFTINRYYLLFTLVLSFIIPLLTIPVYQQYTAVPVMQQVIQMRSIPTIPNYTFTPITAPIQTSSPITWMQLLNWAYLAAVAGLSIHLLITLFNFFIKLKRRKLSSLGNIHILRGDKKLPNGSFLNYIFLNDDALSAEEMEQIVAHEMLHVKLYHSADRIVMKLVQIILWFNPLVYFYARSMEENHEFEVDREVAQSTDKTKYADLLLHLSVANQGMLYHSFSKVPLKKRIIMLFNKPSAKVKRAVYVLVLPVILISCLAFGKIKKEDIKIDLAKSGKEILTAIKTGQDKMVAQLNQPVQLPTLLNADNKSDMLTANSLKNININASFQPHVIYAPTDDTTRYSVFDGVSKNTKITINGKEYPNDILYEISNSNMKGLNMSKDPQTGQWATIDLKTENEQLIYLTAHEKENLRKEQSIPPSQLYTRLHLTKDNGERYDYVAVNLTPKGPRGRNRILPDDKVVFKIDGKLYDENEINTVSPTILASFKNVGSATYRDETLYQGKYKYVFTLSTSDYADSQNNNATAGGGRFGGGRSYTDTTRGIKYYNNLGFFNGGGIQVFDKFDVVGTDTSEYNASAYQIRPNAPLIELVDKVNSIMVSDQGAFVMGRKITSLLIDGKPYNGDVMQGLKSLPADIFSSIRLYRSSGTINVITKPK